MMIFQIFDYLGTGVFAISGALAGINKRFDPFGTFILALVTAIGGGSLRDISIGRTPVGWMQDINYLYIIIGATIITLLFHRYLQYLRKTMFLFDSIGLALFTITGVEIGMASGLHPLVCIMLGTLSAAFGGVIRDILSGEVPLIFHREVYASISILGGIVFLGLVETRVPLTWNYVIVTILVLGLRVLAVRYHWSLHLRNRNRQA